MSENLGPSNASVSIKPISNRQVYISWSFDTFHRQEADGRTYSCYIPSFDIYFSTSDFEKIGTKGKALTKLYFDYFLGNSKSGMKSFILQLHKLGFKAPNDQDTVYKLINNQIIPAKFKRVEATHPIGFGAGSVINQQSNYSVLA